MIEDKLEKIKLINIYYYPNLDFNLILFSQLDHTGVNFNIKQDIISASKDKIIYFEVC